MKRVWCLIQFMVRNFIVWEFRTAFVEILLCGQSNLLKGFGMEDGPIYKRFGTFFRLLRRHILRLPYHQLITWCSSKYSWNTLSIPTLPPAPSINGLEYPFLSLYPMSVDSMSKFAKCHGWSGHLRHPAGMYILDIRGKDFREQPKIVKVEWVCPTPIYILVFALQGLTVRT